MKKRTVFFVILIIASILVIWYVRARGDDPVTVQAVQVAGGTYEETISGIGFVRYDKEQDIQSDNGGRISEVNPEAGTLVKTGEILVRLEEDEIVERMDELQRERNRLEAARKIIIHHIKDLESRQTHRSLYTMKRLKASGSGLPT